MMYFAPFLAMLLIVATLAIMYLVAKSYCWFIDRVKHKKILSCVYILLALAFLYIYLLFTGMAIFA